MKNEIDRITRQLQSKEDAVRELKNANDVYRSKCQFLED
jgi:hypothetical protein